LQLSVSTPIDRKLQEAVADRRKEFILGSGVYLLINENGKVHPNEESERLVCRDRPLEQGP
jgi:hypothetical protein